MVASLKSSIAGVLFSRKGCCAVRLSGVCLCPRARCSLRRLEPKVGQLDQPGTVSLTRMNFPSLAWTTVPLAVRGGLLVYLLMRWAPHSRLLAARLRRPMAALHNASVLTHLEPRPHAPSPTALCFPFLLSRDCFEGNHGQEMISSTHLSAGFPKR